MSGWLADMIKYLCYECAKLLKLTGMSAVNEVGRKKCEGCGGNRDNLIVVNADDCDNAIEKWNIEHSS